MNQEEEKKSVSTLVAELLELSSGFLRQELRATINLAVVRPLKSVGKWLALAVAASTLFSLALIFLAIGAFQLLAELLGATWIAYLIIGAGLLLIGVIPIAVMIRQDEGEQ